MSIVTEKTKTIFFVISGKFDIKDLFLPNGVFDLLLETPETRVVLILPEAKYRSREHVFGTYAAKQNVSVEFIDMVTPRTFVQKCFMFFVKYLIFTDTLSLLAVHGVRADKPPPSIFMKMSYVLKRGIYYILGKSQWIKNTLVPSLFPRLFNEPRYTDLFETYRPDLVFIPDVKPFFGLLFLSEAKRRGVKTVQMPGNWDHFKYYLPLQSDLLLVPNEPLKEEAVRLENYTPERVFVTGFPRFDFFLDPDHIMPRDEFLQKKGFPNDARVIMCVSEGVYSLGDGDVVDMIVGWIESGELPKHFRVLVRPYPPYPGHGEGAKFGKFEQHPLTYLDGEMSWMTLANMKNFINLLYHADIIVNTYSTVTLEGLVFDTPVINIGFDGYQTYPYHKSVRRFVHIDHYKHVTRTGGVKTVTSSGELLSEMRSFFNDPDYNRARRDAVRERMCAPLDRKAAERIVNHLATLMYA